MEIPGLIGLLLPLITCVSSESKISTSCWKDTNDFLSDLNSEKPKFYASMMYDSLGKIGSNVLFGNTYRLGSLSECLAAEAPSGKFRGQYCMLTISEVGNTNNIALCVPDSCTDEDVEQLTTLDILKFKNDSFLKPLPPFSSWVYPNLFVENITCSNGRLPIDAFVTVCLCVCALCFVLPIAGTLYVTVLKWKQQRSKSSNILLSSAYYGSASVNGDNKYNSNGDTTKNHLETNKSPIAEDDSKTRKRSFADILDFTLTSFSLQKNIPFVLTMKSSPGILSALNGIRVLSLFWIVYGHTNQIANSFPLDNKKEYEKTMIADPLHWFAECRPFYLAVDNFFLLSGFLSSRSLISSVEKSEKKEITLKIVVKYIWNRIVRIQPLHLYCICASVGLYTLASYYPMRNIMNMEVNFCRKAWWTNILLINNFVYVKEECAPWTWYIPNDFQLYLITPLLIFLYSKSKCLMINLMAILFLTTFTVVALLSFFSKMPIGIPANTSYDAFIDYVAQYYTKPYCRYGPFLVGMLLGMFLCYRETPLIKNKAQALLGWLLALFTLFMIIVLAYIIDDSYFNYSIAAAIYQALHRTLWTVGVSWIILACEEGYGGFVNQVLSYDIWNLVAKISYACYLVHPMYVFTYYAIQETPFHYSDYNMFYQFCGHSFLTFITGVAFTVIIERPFQLIFHF